jgi:structural maintenance of chromosome 4
LGFLSNNWFNKKLQGEVEQISLMKPKALSENESGLLEYLEDIIGTTRYKRPLQLLNERLEKLNEERTEKHNRCRLAEREMKDLEEPKTAAIEYLKLENKLKYTQNLYYQKSAFETKKKIATLTEEKDQVAGELKAHDDKFEALKQERQEKEKLIQEEIKKHEDLLAKKEEFKTMFDKAKVGRERVQATMKSTNNRRKDLKKQVEGDEKKLEELKNLPEKNKKEVQESEVQIEKLTKQKTDVEEELQANLAKLEDDTRPLRLEKEPLDAELTDIKATLDELKSTYSIAEKELDLIKNDEITEKRKYESLKYSLEESKTTLQEKRQQLEEAEKSVPTLKKTLIEKEQEIQRMHQEELKTSAELSRIKLKIDENVQSMQVSRSNNRVLNALMQQRASGKIPGILGRLGDLGGIDAKYDVAISTCCGRLDNIVVDTVDTAQRCIEFLKTSNIGRGNFIALEKVSVLVTRQII